MSRKKKFNPKVQTDQTSYYSDLAYMPTSAKESKLWFAQSLFSTKLRAVPFLDNRKAAAYRAVNAGVTNEAQYRAIFDPPTAMDEKAGSAPYVSADFKAMPVDQHLDNIVEARIRRLIGSLEVKSADPITKLMDQKEKEKLIIQHWMRDLINEVNKDVGLPPIKESQDPYKYMQSFEGNGKDAGKMLDQIGDVVEQLKLKVKDEEGLRLFMQYLYKNGIEIALETAIKFYLIQQNEWQEKWGNYFFTDIKDFNKYCGEWTIDETTGRGQVGYILPEILYTLPFADKNGDDVLAYFYEKPETWANFERLCGAEMTDEQKQSVLKLQKERGNVAYGYNYSTYQWDNSSFKNDFTIVVGRYGVLTQEANSFSEKYVNGEIPQLDPTPLDWEPDPQSDEGKKVKCYNVWYTCYYIPIVQGYPYTINAPAGWQEQAPYIFKIEKVKDMYRYGTDLRYARPPLVIGQDNYRMSYTDIKEAFMPKINHLWHKFQNYCTNDMKSSLIDQGLVETMLNAVDDANKTEFQEKGQVTGKAGDAVVNSFKMIRQGGMAFLNFRDKNGVPILDPSKLVFNIDNENMAKATECLVLIGGLYNEMTRALAISDVGEGLAPKPRTALGGIEASLEASRDASWAIEQMYSNCLIQFSKRVIQHVHTICKEKAVYGYKERWDELNAVIGTQNGATLESIQDIPLSNLGISVQREDTSAKRELLLTLATNLFDSKEIYAATLGLVMDLDSWKIQMVVLGLAMKDKAEQLQMEAQIAHDRQLELGKQQLDIQQQIIGIKTQGAIAEENNAAKNLSVLQDQLNQLKAQTQILLSEQRTTNRIKEQAAKAEFDKDKETHAAIIESVQQT